MLVLASANAGKLRELRALLADLPLHVRASSEFPELSLPEEGDDYAANAAAKALACFKRPFPLPARGLEGYL